MNPPQLLFHYTTYQGALGILESSSLWASSARHLNDALEYRYAYSLVRDKVLVMPRGASGSYGRDMLDPFRDALQQDEAPPKFVASFSAKGDMLSQWRAYGRGQLGVAIGFNAARLVDQAKSACFELKPCEYNCSRQLEILTNLHHEALDRRLVGPKFFSEKHKEVAAVFKHPSFEEEQEWRLVGYPTDLSSLRCRASDAMIVPYCEIPLKLTNTNLISKLILGSCPHSEDVMAALQMYIHSKGLSECCLVEKSRSPYRVI